MTGLLALLALGAPLAAEPRAAPDASALPFAGVNLLSPLPALTPVPVSTLSSLLCNLEVGFGASGGVVLGGVHRLEARGAIGPNSAQELLLNVGTSYGWYGTRALGWSAPGLYAGGGLRAWDLYGTATGVHRPTVAAAAEAGYRFELGRLYLDLRAHELLGLRTWSSEPHTLGGWATLGSPWIPKAPLLSLDLGVALGPGRP